MSFLDTRTLTGKVNGNWLADRFNRCCWDLVYALPRTFTSLRASSRKCTKPPALLIGSRVRSREEAAAQELREDITRYESDDMKIFPF